MRDPWTFELIMERRKINNSIPVIQRRILQILSAADGQRLKRSHLTLRLSKKGCTCQENRIEALRQLEAAGKIRRENSGRYGDIFALVASAAA